MPAQRILIVQLGRIGDLILMTAMFRALKETNAGHQIHLLAGRHNHRAALALPFLDKVYAHTKKPWATVQLLRQLRREEYDLWIDPKDHYSRESHFFARWGRAKHKIGFNRAGQAPVFDEALPGAEEQPDDHVTKRNLRALRHFHLDNADPRPVLLTLPAYDARLQDVLQRQRVSNYYCVHLSASRDIRYWPTLNWIALLSQIAAEERWIFLTYGPGDENLAGEIARQVKHVALYRTDSIVEMFSVVKGAQMVISPDTSVVHIAAAFDRPLLGLYSNHEWNYKKFHPLSTHFRAVMGPQPGTLVQDIPVDLVLRGYEELLHEIKEAKPKRKPAAENKS